LIAAVLTFAVGIAHAQAGLNDLEVAHAAYTADVIDPTDGVCRSGALRGANYESSC
jgi:hypothetical protein